MRSIVVKDISYKVSSLFGKFAHYVRSEKVRSLTRKHPHDFTRTFKFPWFDVLFYLIFRSETCTQSELTKYFSIIDRSHLRISKQAAFKALKKVRPDVFLNLIHTFAYFFYQSDLVKTYKGYILLAEDGTAHELYPSKEALNQFGFVTNQYIRCADDAQKVTSRSAALYDVTNGLIVDFTMNPFKKSEIPIAIEHIHGSSSLFKGKKVIYLSDRYYDSVELFSILEHHSFNYCIRGKSNFFKNYVSSMISNDEWIDVSLDKAWIKRLKYDQPKDRFEKDPVIRIRVVKHTHTYQDKNDDMQRSDFIYFTNLSDEEFTTNDIVNLYAKRWDIECTYKTLKTDYEWERFFSEDCDCEMCAIYAKVLFHNIVGIVRKELNNRLEKDPANHDNQYSYTINIVQLSHLLRDNHICRWMRSRNKNAIRKLMDLILSHIHKIKVPIRKNRHNQRWGRLVSSSKPFRFRLDGRSWPRVAYTKGHLQTVQP